MHTTKMHASFKTLIPAKRRFNTENYKKKKKKSAKCFMEISCKKKVVSSAYANYR